MYPQSELCSKLKVIQETIPKEQQIYTQLEGVENFIIHLSSLENERTRARISIQINDYLDQFIQKERSETDLKTLSQSLYPTFWKISNTYTDNAGFIQKPNIIWETIIAVVIFVVVLYFFNVLIASLGTITVIVIRTFYHNKKVKQKRYY